MINFNGFTKKTALLGDLNDVWERCKLPQSVEDNYSVIESYIRHLHTSEFRLFKDSLIVDHFIQSNNSDNIVIQLNKQYLGIWLVTVYVDSSKYEYYDFLCKEEDLDKVLGDY